MQGVRGDEAVNGSVVDVFPVEREWWTGRAGRKLGRGVFLVHKRWDRTMERGRSRHRQKKLRRRLSLVEVGRRLRGAEVEGWLPVLE